MPQDAQQIMTFLAEGYEKIASSIEKAAQKQTRNSAPDNSEFDRGYFAGYAEGQIRAYRDIAADLRKALRDSRP
jgi:hypothetical protein